MGTCAGSTNKHQVKVQINYHSNPNQRFDSRIPTSTPSQHNNYQPLHQKTHPHQNPFFPPHSEPRTSNANPLGMIQGSNKTVGKNPYSSVTHKKEFERK